MNDDHLHESRIPWPSALAANGFQLCACNGVDAIIPPLCQVPAGAFLMGSNGNASHATPQSQIAVTAFAMAMFPVTVAEYALYLHANPSIAPPSDNVFPTAVNWLAPEWRGKRLTWALQQQQPDVPVVNISWFNARDYAVWLTEVIGEKWRLPTEAEWEKAARGTDGRRYPWGNHWDATRTNMIASGPKFLMPVGSYAGLGDGSPYGCHDMAGNVWEWCSSLFHPYPYDATTCEKKGAYIKKYRVLRGGCWASSATDVRVTHRNFSRPDFFSDAVGYRLVRER